jgi:hypothetical protein
MWVFVLNVADSVSRGREPSGLVRVCIVATRSATSLDCAGTVCNARRTQRSGSLEIRGGTSNNLGINSHVPVQNSRGNYSRRPRAFKKYALVLAPHSSTYKKPARIQPNLWHL